MAIAKLAFTKRQLEILHDALFQAEIEAAGSVKHDADNDEVDLERRDYNQKLHDDTLGLRLRVASEIEALGE